MTRDTSDDTIYVDFAQARLNRTTDMLHLETRALLAYWDRLRDGRRLPFRAEIDPRDMNCDPRNLFILESLGAGNIRFRLAGTALVEAFGMELRGMSVRAIMQGKARESISALLEETMAEPGIGYARLRDSADSSSHWEILLLPLRSDFGATDRIIGALVPVGHVRGPGSTPLRFEIEEMSIRPVTALKPEDAPTPAMGFAESQTPFAAPPALPNETARETGPTQLRAIEGGLTDDQDEGDRPRRRKPNLRVVSDD
ncbi:MAG: PAS domain-containing protein [Pseudomonadota bacterium]